jgi:hypothetical protein
MSGFSVIKSVITCTIGQEQLLWSNQENGTGRARSTNGERRNEYRLLAGKSEEKRDY